MMKIWFKKPGKELVYNRNVRAIYLYLYYGCRPDCYTKTAHYFKTGKTINYKRP